MKIMQDGVAENHTAALLEPVPRPPAAARRPTRASRFVDPAELRDLRHRSWTRTASRCTSTRWATGPYGRRWTPSRRRGAANGRRDTRPHLAHLQVVHPDDVPRFARLGAAANIQALWAVHEPQMDELTIPFLGPERAAWQYPFGDLLRAGRHARGGQRLAGQQPRPDRRRMHVAVNRTRAGTPRPARFLPGQRLDLGTALTAYTGGQRLRQPPRRHRHHRVGHAADLAVLDRDPFAGPPEEIAATRVLQTFVGGSRVYAAEDA